MNEESSTPETIDPLATAPDSSNGHSTGNGKPRSGRMTLAQVNRKIRLAEDTADYLERLVDFSGISDFGDGDRGGDKFGQVGTVQAALPGAVELSIIYPGATAWAYRNEIQLRQIRAVSRVFTQTNPYAIGAIRNRIAYTVGTGHTYKITPRDPDGVDDETLKDCRTIIDNFRKRNKWTKRQKETVRRLDRDGERFLRLFIDEKKGEVNVRFVEPLEIQNPPDKTSAAGCYFGIQFAKATVTPDENQSSQPVWDVETPETYYIVNIGTLGETISLRETVPADQMQHLKANVDMTWPRGLPTLWVLQPNLENAIKTLKATGKIVEFRARIAMIRRHVNAARESVQRFVAENSGKDADPRHAKTAAQYPWMSTLDTSDATEYQFPANTVPVDSNIAAIQAELKAAAAALAMPEFMISSDASNSSYSSTMVAEGPAVKTFEEMQQELIDSDVEIMELQLCIAAKAGLISGASGDPPESDDSDSAANADGESKYILDLVKIEAEPPIIKHEESFEEAQADQIIYKLGVMSDAELCARHKMVSTDQRVQIETEQQAKATWRAKMQALGFQFDPISGGLIPPPPQAQIDPATGQPLPPAPVTDPETGEEIDTQPKGEPLPAPDGQGEQGDGNSGDGGGNGGDGSQNQESLQEAWGDAARAASAARRRAKASTKAALSSGTSADHRVAQADNNAAADSCDKAAAECKGDAAEKYRDQAEQHRDQAEVHKQFAEMGESRQEDLQDDLQEDLATLTLAFGWQAEKRVAATVWAMDRLKKNADPTAGEILAVIENWNILQEDEEFEGKHPRYPKGSPDGGKFIEITDTGKPTKDPDWIDTRPGHPTTDVYGRVVPREYLYSATQNAMSPVLGAKYWKDHPAPGFGTVNAHGSDKWAQLIQIADSRVAAAQAALAALVAGRSSGDFGQQTSDEANAEIEAQKKIESLKANAAALRAKAAEYGEIFKALDTLTTTIEQVKAEDPLYATFSKMVGRPPTEDELDAIRKEMQRTSKVIDDAAMAAALTRATQPHPGNAWTKSKSGTAVPVPATDDERAQLDAALGRKSSDGEWEGFQQLLKIYSYAMMAVASRKLGTAGLNEAAAIVPDDMREAVLAAAPHIAAARKQAERAGAIGRTAWSLIQGIGDLGGLIAPLVHGTKTRAYAAQLGGAIEEADSFAGSVWNPLNAPKHILKMLPSLLPALAVPEAAPWYFGWQGIQGSRVTTGPGHLWANTTVGIITGFVFSKLPSQILGTATEATKDRVAAYVGNLSKVFAETGTVNISEAAINEATKDDPKIAEAVYDAVKSTFASMVPMALLMTPQLAGKVKAKKVGEKLSQEEARASGLPEGLSDKQRTITPEVIKAAEHWEVNERVRQRDEELAREAKEKADIKASAEAARTAAITPPEGTQFRTLPSGKVIPILGAEVSDVAPTLAKAPIEDPEGDMSQAELIKRADSHDVVATAAESTGDKSSAEFHRSESARLRQKAADMGSIEAGRPMAALSQAASGVADDVKSAADGVVKIAKFLQQVFSPASVSPEAGRMAGNIREKASELAILHDQARASLDYFGKLLMKLTPDLRWDFVDQVETGVIKPDLDPKLAEAADVIRELLDTAREKVQALGKGYLEEFYEDYFPHIWKDPAKAEQVNLGVGRQFSKSPAFLHERTINTIKEGLAAGLEPVTDNPVELVMLKLHEMNKYIMGQNVLAEGKENGYIKFARNRKAAPEGWVKINGPLGEVTERRPTKRADGSEGPPESVRRGDYYAHPDAARIFNNYLSPGFRGNQLYDALRYGGNMLNQVQLGLSGFHITGTAINSIVSYVGLAAKQFADGHPLLALKTAVTSFTAPIESLVTGSKVIAEGMRPGTQGGDIAAIVDGLQAGGSRLGQDQMWRLGQTSHSAWDSFVNAARKSQPSAAPKFVAAVCEQTSRPVMESIVPKMKVGVAAKLAEYELEKLPPGATREQIREVMGKVWDSVDNRMGQLVYDNLFWEKTLKDTLMLSTRSLGWNLGTVRELGGGLADIVNLARGGEFTHRAAYAMALPMVTGIMGAVATYLYTGRGPQSLLDYYFPPTGKLDADGSQQRVSLPTYMKDVIAFSMHPVDTAVNKLSPMHSAVAQMLQNRDFYGDQIRNPNDPVIQQVLQEAKFIGSQFVPFSVRGAQVQQQRGEGLGGAALSFVGVNPAPRALIESPMMQFIHAETAGFQPATRTPDEAAKHDTKSQILQLYESGQQIPEDLQQKVTPKILEELQKKAIAGRLVSSFKPLTLTKAIAAAKLATAEEWEKVQPILASKYGNQAKKFRNDEITKEEWQQMDTAYRDLIASKPKISEPDIPEPKSEPVVSSPVVSSPVPAVSEPAKSHHADTAAKPDYKTDRKTGKKYYYEIDPTTGAKSHHKTWVSESLDQLDQEAYDSAEPRNSTGEWTADPDMGDQPEEEPSESPAETKAHAAALVAINASVKADKTKLPKDYAVAADLQRRAAAAYRLCGPAYKRTAEIHSKTAEAYEKMAKNAPPPKTDSASTGEFTGGMVID